MDKNYELLCGKQILRILDGDIKFGELELSEFGTVIDISMPYLSGPKLCDISNMFGLPVSYGSGASSRWVYLDDIIRHCIKQRTVQKLLSYIFSKKQFTDKLRGLPVEKIDEVYEKITKRIIEQINGELYFSEFTLKNNNGNYYLEKIGSSLKVNTPSIKNVTRKYISEISRRANEDIERGELDSAITKSRTLLEETFCHAIELAKCEPSNNGKIDDLYKQVKQLYNMHTDKNVDKRINTLLSGLNKIVSAISDMRNNNSDSHGMGSKRINISKHHAKLCVNSSAIVAEFILEVIENKK